MDKETISKVMSHIGKMSHKKSPRSKEALRKMQAKGVITRNKRKLSTGKY